MSKKVFVAAAAVALLMGGCATHQQSNQLAGAAIGGIIGHEVGGRQGAAVGAALGTIIGGQQPAAPPAVMVTPPPAVYYAPPPRVYQQRQICTVNQYEYRRRTDDCYRRSYSYYNYGRDTFLRSCLENARSTSTFCR